MMQPVNPNKDVEVSSPPNDGISSISWSSKGNFFVASSWDNSVRCWEVQNASAVPKALTSHDAPVLCTSWHGDGSKVFSAGCDNKAKCWTLATNQSAVVAQHAAPIKCCFWIEEMQCLVTGSWDKTLKYWDMRSSNPVASINLPERCYVMDVKYPLAVVGTAERHVIIYDLKNPTAEYKKIVSPLKWQTRSLACFPSRTGFAIGSIEGRVGIHNIDDKEMSKNFAFKCHRQQNDIYAVNSISFHPQFGTFATAGADGVYNFWDKDSKQRLKPFDRCAQPISCANFNRDGAIYAYAVSYDWSKGHEYYNPQTSKNYIFLHPTQESEIKNRASK